jgi:hypothetical protein
MCSSKIEYPKDAAHLKKKEIKQHAHTTGNEICMVGRNISG